MPSQQQISELYDLYTAHPAVTTDSRHIPEGAIFFALRGPSFDGNAFAAEALRKGAALAVVDDPEAIPSGTNPGRDYFLVDNVLQTLQELAAMHRTRLGIPILAITGTNGKTTTTTMTGEILRAAGYDVAVGGNIGESFAYTVATADREWYVLELSSFQLDGIVDFRPDIAVITNITPDHLDRYGNKFQNYIDSKFRIIRNQRPEDYFIYGIDNMVICREIALRTPSMRMLPFTAKTAPGCTDTHIPAEGRGYERRTDNAYRTEEQAAGEAGQLVDDVTVHDYPGAFYIPAGVFRVSADGRTAMIDPSRMKIKGIHNIYNAEAAALAALAAGVSPSVVEDTLYAFTGVEHRMEPAGTVGGVEYINDSKATNVDSAWYALDSMTRPTVWIAGGTDKGNDYDVLKPLAERHVKALVCMGVDNAKLIRDFTGIVPVIYDTHSLDEAMRVCTEAAEPGDTVLLSPACASFDLFRNYEERGRLFKAAVERLKENAW